MHGGLEFISQISLISLAALIGGLCAKKLGQPVILGYLVAGVAIGILIPELVASRQTVDAVAQWGVILLLFALGTEFSPKSLWVVRKVCTAGALLQMTLSTMFGYAIARVLGFSTVESVFAGFVTAMSSTMIVLKLLDDHGETGTYHGKVMLGILVIQDLAAIMFAAILPNLHSFTFSTLPTVGTSLLRATVYLALAAVLMTKVLPYLLDVVAAVKSRELFILSVVGIALAAAVGTEMIGFSLALGAFVAGLLLSESEYSHQIIAEVKPFRDFFAAIFFVSIGMLLSPTMLVRNITTVLSLVAVVIVGKSLIIFLVMLALRQPSITPIAVGLGLAQIGEFSFILASIGLGAGVISDRLYGLTIAVTVLTMFLSAFFPRLVPILYNLAMKNPIYRRLTEIEVVDEIESRASETEHVLVCGCGRVGSKLIYALDQLGIPHVGIDYDHNVVRKIRELGHTAIYGDVSNPEILERAGAKIAIAALMTIPDAIAASLAADHLRQVNPTVFIIARAHSQSDMEMLYQSGADSVVWPEMEAGVEMIRDLAAKMDMQPDEIDRMAEIVREPL